MNRTESTIIAGGFNTLLSEMDKSSRQKISKDIIALNTTINQLDILNIYRQLHPRTVECTFFSSADGTVFKRQYSRTLNKP